MLNFPEGLIEAACLTVGQRDEDIEAWIDYYAQAVQSRLPDGLYYDKHSDMVFYYDNDKPITDKWGKLLDDADIWFSDSEFESLLHEAEQEADGWWLEDAKTVYYCETNGYDLIISVDTNGEVHYITDELLDELDIFSLNRNERAARVFEFLAENGGDDAWNSANDEGITLESLLDGVKIIAVKEIVM